MRIQIYCRHFSPAIGGMEKLLETLAKEFTSAGHAVCVVTETPGDGCYPYPVYRNPTFRQYLRIARSNDVILSAPLSLRRLPAQLLARKPIAFAHPDKFGGRGIAMIPSFIKRSISRIYCNIVPSLYMAKYFSKSIVIYNPYDNTQFFPPIVSKRRKDILFVGRLVEGKGCALLLSAFASIRNELQGANITIVGEGPQLNDLQILSRDLNIEDRVKFCGPVVGTDLAEIVQSHAVMAVPTITDEPFGIVALEGLACECQMVVARSGGLPEAVGHFAYIFEKGSVAELAEYLRRAVLKKYSVRERYELREYLQRFKPASIAESYIGVLADIGRR